MRTTLIHTAGELERERRATTERTAIAHVARQIDYVYAVIPGPPLPMPRPLATIVPTASARATLARAHRARSLRDLYGCFRAQIVSQRTAVKVWKRAAEVALEVAKRQAGYGPRPILPTGEALDVLILIVTPLPKSAWRKTATYWPQRVWLVRGGQSGGDWDNYAKTVCDAGNGILWPDDCQIARGMVETIRARQGEPPRTELLARPLWDSPDDTIFEREIGKLEGLTRV